MPTPNRVLTRRYITPEWAALHRDRAHSALTDARRSAFSAEWALELAERHVKDREGGEAEYQIERAFYYLTQARGSRVDAKRHALMAVRAVDLESWPSARAEIASRLRDRDISFG